MAALSQTTLGLLKPKKDQNSERNRLILSRILVLVWGIILSAFAVELDSLRGKVNVVVLAFGMISYTTGPMLGMFLASLLTPKTSIKGLSIGFAFSFLLVASLRPDFYQILINYELISFETALDWSFLQEVKGKLAIKINTVWAWPVTVFITWGFGLLIPRKQKLE